MMKKFSLCLLFLLIVAPLLLSQNLELHFETQKISKPIRQMVKKMAAFEELHSSAVGYAGQKTEQYQRFEQLVQQATLEELVELCKHPAPCVRVYAFWGLAKKQYEQLETVFMAHAADNQHVLGIQGCIPMGAPVIDWMTLVVRPQMLDWECKKLDDAVLTRMHIRREMLIKAKNDPDRH